MFLDVLRAAYLLVFIYMYRLTSVLPVPKQIIWGGGGGSQCRDAETM